jgi:aminopeptidase N
MNTLLSSARHTTHLSLPTLCLCLLASLTVAAAPEPEQRPPASAGTEAVYPDSPPPGRLPAGVRPLAYVLDLLLDPRGERFSGTVDIRIERDHPGSYLWLHGKGLEVSEARAQLPDGSQIEARYEELLDSGVARVDFAEQLPAGPFTLHLAYSADYDRNLAGLFKVEEQGRAYVLAKSESIQARKYLPGFDEPGMKAPFDISLRIPSGYAAISNGREIRRGEAGEGLEKVTFATTRPMPTYLLSLSVGPFDVVERAPIPPNAVRETAIPLRGFARSGRGDDLDYILDVTADMVAIFERELQRPYPFDKLDIVAAPQWPSGATELSAAITYREQRILVAGDAPAPGARLDLLGVHAHELAHMWFGNLVTPPWWDDLWLKEGFATWGTPLALTRLEPEGGHELDATVRAISAMQLDSLASTRAIREDISDNHDIRNAYDAITYAKSLGVIHMVDQYFGSDRFRPALGRYVAAFADGVADSADFYRLIGEQTDTPSLTATFRDFVEQKGVPALAIGIYCDGDEPRLEVRQSRYRPLGSPIAESGQRWHVPFCLISDNAERQCHMLSAGSEVLDLPGTACPRWVLPNAGGSGYYRWVLPEPQWHALLDAFGDFAATEQLAIIDSAFAAFEAGQLPAPLLSRLIGVAAQAEARQVVTAPLPYLTQYQRRYVQAAQQGAFRASLIKWYLPVFKATATSGEPDRQLLHSEVLGFLALTAEEPTARDELRQRAEAFTGFGQERRPDALDSDLYQVALSVALQDSGEAFLEHLLTLRGELDDPLFDNASANALGAVTAGDQLERIHTLILSDALGPRESFGLLQHALAEPATREQHWRWLQAHFPDVLEKIPEQWRRRTPSLAGTFCDNETRSQLRELFGEYGDRAPGHARSLAQTEERIALCMALREPAEGWLASLEAQNAPNTSDRTHHSKASAPKASSKTINTIVIKKIDTTKPLRLRTSPGLST